MRWLILFFIFVSCGPKSETALIVQKKESSEYKYPEDKFEAFMVVVNSRCIPCHYEGSNIGRNFQPYQTPQDWIDSGDVSPRRPDLSPMFYFIRGAGIYPEVEFVPSLNPDLKTEEIEVLRTFILEYDF